MDASRVELLKAAMTQHGRGQPIQVFRGLSRYQHGCGFGNALLSIWRFVYPVLSRGVVNLQKFGGDAYKQNGNVMAALKAAAKPTIGAMIKTTGQEIERRLDAAEAVKPEPSLPHHRSLQRSIWTRAKFGRRRHLQAASRADAGAPKLHDAGVDRSCMDYIRKQGNSHAP